METAAARGDPASGWRLGRSFRRRAVALRDGGAKRRRAVQSAEPAWSDKPRFPALANAARSPWRSPDVSIRIGRVAVEALRSSSTSPKPSISGICRSVRRISKGLPRSVRARMRLESVARAGGCFRPHPPAAQLLLENAPVCRIVVNHQNGYAFQRDLVCLVTFLTGIGGGSNRNRELEPASPARFALHLDCAAHGFRQTLGNGQTKSRSAEVAGCRPVALGKGLENDLLFVRGNAYPGIAAPQSGEKRARLSRASRLTSTATSPAAVNFTALPTRLTRICRMRVASPMANRGTSGRTPPTSSRPLACAAAASCLDAFLHQIANIETSGFDFQPAGLDFREIEHFVDYRQHQIGGHPDRFQVVPLYRTEIGVESQTGHADDAVHGRADFVAHIGQKFALGAAGRFGLFFGRSAGPCSNGPVRRYGPSPPVPDGRGEAAVPRRGVRSPTAFH